MTRESPADDLKHGAGKRQPGMEEPKRAGREVLSVVEEVERMEEKKGTDMPDYVPDDAARCDFQVYGMLRGGPAYTYLTYRYLGEGGRAHCGLGLLWQVRLQLRRE